MSKYPMFKRNRLYPYNRWFQKGILILRFGIDYNCTSPSIVQQIRNEATIRKAKISVYMKVYAKKPFIVFINWDVIFKGKSKKDAKAN